MADDRSGGGRGCATSPDCPSSGLQCLVAHWLALVRVCLADKTDRVKHNPLNCSHGVWCLYSGGRPGAGTKRSADAGKENPSKKPKAAKPAVNGAVSKPEASTTSAPAAAAVSPAKVARGKGAKRPRKSDGALSDSTNAAEDAIVGSGRQVRAAFRSQWTFCLVTCGDCLGSRRVLNSYKAPSQLRGPTWLYLRRG